MVHSSFLYNFVLPGPFFYSTITNVQRNANIFNEYFSNQCQIDGNGSTLPGITTKTNALITHVTISKKANC